MKTVAIDTEYDYCSPFLATITDEEMQTKVYRPKVLSQKRELKKICEGSYSFDISPSPKSHE